MIRNYENPIAVLGDRVLAEKGKKYLRMIKLYEYLPVTEISRLISEGTGDAQATVRWHLTILRDLGLIICGRSGNRGIPTRVSTTGKIILKHLDYEDIFVGSVEFY